MKLSISKPCSENYQYMSPTEKGRFCASCKKEVIDFTSLTDSQIREFFLSQNSRVCGRLSSTQLSHIYESSAKSHPIKHNWIAAVFSTLLVVSTSNLKAETTWKDVLRMPFNFKLSTCEKDRGLLSSDSLKIVRGKVKDQSGETLPGAAVKLEGTEIETISLSDGSFEIKVPAHLKFTAVVLQASYIGFKTISKNLSNYKEGEQLTLTLTSENYLGMISIDWPQTKPSKKKSKDKAGN